MRAIMAGSRARQGLVALCLWAALLPGPARAERNWNLTSVAFGSGNESVNGYVSAGTALDYEVRHCGEGTIYLVAGIRPGTMQLESRYWYKGKLRDVPAAMMELKADHMWISGRASYGINHVRFGGRIGTSDKASCWFDGIPLPATPKGVKPEDFVRTFTVHFDRSTTVLRNEAFEKYLDQLDAQEREAEAARKKEEAAQRKAEAERKKADAERLAKEQREKAEAARQAAAPPAAGGSTAGGSGAATATGGAAAGSVKAGSNDFWGDSGGAAPCGDPTYVTSGNRYFRKDCQGRLQEVNMDDYYRYRKQQEARQQADARAERERAAGAALQRLQEQQRAQAAENARVERELDTRMGGLRAAYAAGARLEEARDAVRDLSRLEASYASVEELQGDFDRRLGALNDRFDEMREANREKARAGVDAFYGNDQYRSVGELTGMVAVMASDNALDKERKAARAEMYRQKEQLEREIEAQRKARQLALRKELLATFADSPLPTSTQKIAADTLYFFAYATPPGAAEQEGAGMTVTSVFPVARRGDGGWPFKRSFNEELRPLAGNDLAWAGYYTSLAEAEAQRARFLEFARKGGFGVREVEYRGRAAPAAPRAGKAPAAGPDFWNGDAGKSGAARDDFW